MALLRMSSPPSMKEPAMSLFLPTLRATALGVASILIIVLVPIPLLAAIWFVTGFNIFTFRCPPPSIQPNHTRKITS